MSQKSDARGGAINFAGPGADTEEALLVDRAGLPEKPVKFTFPDKAHHG